MTKPKGNSQRCLQIDKSVASLILRIFDCAYKMGVNDACQADDSGAVREHIDLLQSPDKFGRITTIDVGDDWLFWQLTLRLEILSNQLYKSAYSAFERYTINAGNAFRNYLGIAYTLAKAFYMLGLNDWEKSRLSDLSAFNSKSKQRLVDGKVKDWKLPDMISDSQIMCYEQAKLHRESECRFKNTDLHFKTFTRALALASMRKFDSIS